MKKPESITAFDQTELAEKRELLLRVESAAKTTVVNSAASAERTVEWIRIVKDEAKNLEEMRVSATKPLNESLRTINGWFRPLQQILERAEVALKSAVATWQVEEKKRQAALLQQAVAEHEAGNHAAVQATLAKSEPVRDPAGTTVRQVWQASIVDVNAVPRDWCVPDGKRIAAVARATPADVTPTPIPGVRFELVANLTVRS